MTAKLRNLPKDCIPIPENPPIGITEYVTAIGFFICQVHYTADPIKRKPEWKQTRKRGFSDRDWRRELEIDWSVAGGTPIFPEYEKGRHESDEILKPLPYLPVIVGLDPGLNPAAVFLQIQTLGEEEWQKQVRVLRTLVGENKAMNVFGPEILAMQMELEEEAGQSLTFEYYGDPFGDAKTSTEGRTPYQVLRNKCGIQVKQGKQRWGLRRSVVSERLLVNAAPGVPGFIISNHPSNEILKAGFGGAYAYPETAATTSDMPVKNKFSHPQDAVQYPLTVKFPVMAEKVRMEAVETDMGPAMGVGERTENNSSAKSLPSVFSGFGLSIGNRSQSRNRQTGPRRLAFPGLPAFGDDGWNPAIQSAFDDMQGH